jgi:hypothetical protein
MRSLNDFNGLRGPKRTHLRIPFGPLRLWFFVVMNTTTTSAGCTRLGQDIGPRWRGCGDTIIWHAGPQLGKARTAR